MISLTLCNQAISAESKEELSAQLLNMSTSLYDIADQNDLEVAAMQVELERAQSLLSEQDANITDLSTTIDTLQEKIALTKSTQNQMATKFDEINLNYEKYVFRTRTKAIVPFIYGALAFTFDGSEEDPVLYALAGYGTGALIENTGFGLSRGITWLWYSFSF